MYGAAASGCSGKSSLLHAPTLDEPVMIEKTCNAPPIPSTLCLFPFLLVNIAAPPHLLRALHAPPFRAPDRPRRIHPSQFLYFKISAYRLIRPDPVMRMYAAFLELAELLPSFSTF